MNKISIIITLIFTIGFFTKPIFANEEEHNLDLQQIITEIIDKQKVNNIKDIDCNKITDEQFELVGEAFMSQRHPDEQEHKLMDNMMGGEGSETLKYMHINMGRNYLGCSPNNTFGMGSGMMGFGMINNKFSSSQKNLNDVYNMMGRTNNGFNIMHGNWIYSGMWLFAVILWIMIFIFLALGIVYFYKQLKRKDN